VEPATDEVSNANPLVSAIVPFPDLLLHLPLRVYNVGLYRVPTPQVVGKIRSRAHLKTRRAVHGPKHGGVLHRQGRD